ncbi:tRNA pseudouridine(38-40) synthase TruA [Bacillus sp. Marseille-P3661]|uniref:tRNA pseudouridine(38-40) synthase TruA n=1 Tax=Bacillus sp. Marseille-P3661 TaxID=1936234 RepID=UPI000C8388DA|nr:tRNA pseudouridine(38-40) synthase TruA [Bacillus sp. Marseille-P3661]
MNRLKCTISYDGTSFAGFQVQPKQRTVQGEIERALKKIHKTDEIPRIAASGRTDAGVHAHGQVIHFDSPLTGINWARALNTLLPEDIIVDEVESVPTSFHARFDVIKKEYRYFLLNSQKNYVFRRNYCYHYPYRIELDAIKAAADYLIGTHDFTSFCSTKTDKQDKIRTIYTIDVIEEAGEIVFRFVGDGFLYNMVRIMVGTLLKVGQGKIKPEEIKGILDKKDRETAGKTVPGHGLHLWKVWY